MPDHLGTLPHDYLGAEALNVWVKDIAHRATTDPHERQRLREAMMQVAEVCLTAAYLEPGWTVETLDKISEYRKDLSGIDDDRPNRQAAVATLRRLVELTIVYRQGIASDQDALAASTDDSDEDAELAGI